MRKELDNKLCKDFPNLYRDRGGRKSQTCMYWGFSCGDGWYDIIYRLSEKLEKLILQLPLKDRPNCRASQVKEKFGTLRFYMASSTDEMEYWINEAEKESARTCEDCGSHFYVRKTVGGWICTLCFKHRWQYYFEKCKWWKVPIYVVKTKYYKLEWKLYKLKKYLTDLFHGF